MAQFGEVARPLHHRAEQLAQDYPIIGRVPAVHLGRDVAAQLRRTLDKGRQIACNLDPRDSLEILGNMVQDVGLEPVRRSGLIEVAGHGIVVTTVLAGYCERNQVDRFSVVQKLSVKVVVHLSGFLSGLDPRTCGGCRNSSGSRMPDCLPIWPPTFRRQPTRRFAWPVALPNTTGVVVLRDSCFDQCHDCEFDRLIIHTVGRMDTELSSDRGGRLASMQRGGFGVVDFIQVGDSHVPDHSDFVT